MPPAARDHHGSSDPAARVAAIAKDGAALLLGLDPVLGDHATQVAVDAFVERAADALVAVADAAGPGTAGGGPAL
jgi:hypothetical protein